MAGKSEKSKSPKPKKRQRWRKKRWWVLATLTLFLGWVYFIPRLPFGPYQLYADLTPQERVAKLPFEKLSTQKFDPFLGLKQIPEFETNLNRFPDVRSCLVASEAEKVEPDLRLMDWDKPKSLFEVQICLWRIFSSLGTPERVHQWMLFHDLEAIVIPQTDVGAINFVTVSGSRSYETNRVIWPAVGVFRFSYLFHPWIKGESIGATWKNNNLTTVNFGHNSF